METTPKNFALQIGALITLYISMWSLITLLFSIININFPDIAAGSYDYASSQDGARYAIASLIVFFPTYLWLTRLVNKARRHESSLYHNLTKWVVYLSLVVGGLIILGNLVAVILTFLNGEITTRFVLKVISMVVVVGAAFWYYLQDAKGYWNTREKQSLQIGGALLVAITAIVIFGVTVIDSPTKVREMRLDQQQITDLQDVQWRIEEYFRVEQKFPETLADVYESETLLPTSPAGRADYQYKIVDDASYELCATFVHPTNEDSRGVAISYPTDKFAINYNWNHDAGEKCFKRVIEKPVETLPTPVAPVR